MITLSASKYMLQQEHRFNKEGEKGRKKKRPAKVSVHFVAVISIIPLLGPSLICGKCSVHYTGVRTLQTPIGGVNGKTMKDLSSHKMRKTDSFATIPLGQGMSEYPAAGHHYRARGVRQLGPNVVEAKIGSSMRA